MLPLESSWRMHLGLDRIAGFCQPQIMNISSNNDNYLALFGTYYIPGALPNALDIFAHLILAKTLWVQ